MMKRRYFPILCLATIAVFSTLALAEEEAQAKAEAAKPTKEELEAKFKDTLTNATMAGRWCLIKDSELTPEKEDKYDIVSVTKTTDDNWIIQSRIRWNNFDFTIPVPVQIGWAQDTPVIIVDNMGVPGGNTYSARVVVYDDSYAGTWSGPGVKGLLNGQITKKPDETTEKAEAKASEDSEPDAEAKDAPQK